MSNEIWMPVKGYEGCYEVSNLGNVRSLDRVLKNRFGEYFKKGRLLKGGIDSNGYPFVILSKNNKSKTKKRHKLVAISFLGHVPSGNLKVIDHKNNNPLDNRVENLQIISHRENTSKDKYRKNISSKYVGVSWHKSAKKWEACINVKGSKKYLGLYDNEKEASIAYEYELKKIKCQPSAYTA